MKRFKDYLQWRKYEKARRVVCAQFGHGAGLGECICTPVNFSQLTNHLFFIKADRDLE